MLSSSSSEARNTDCTFAHLESLSDSGDSDGIPMHTTSNLDEDILRSSLISIAHTQEADDLQQMKDGKRLQGDGRSIGLRKLLCKGRSLRRGRQPRFC